MALLLTVIPAVGQKRDDYCHPQRGLLQATAPATIGGAPEVPPKL